MSGYLKRLAASAMTPHRSVRPMVGSIFSPSKEVGMPAPLEVEEEIPAAESRAESAATEAPHIDVPAAEAQPLPRNAGEHDRSTAERVLPPQSQILPMVLQRKPALRVPPIGERLPKQTQAMREKDPESREETGVERERVFTPLLPQRAGNEAERTGIRESVAQGGAAPKKEPLAAPVISSRAAGPAREPDEIQIHIGRIEVTAASENVARPSPPAARKSINLEEYLKRGRGRA
jgi:hypothetical protein